MEAKFLCYSSESFETSRFELECLTITLQENDHFIITIKYEEDENTFFLTKLLKRLNLKFQVLKDFQFKSRIQ